MILDTNKTKLRTGEQLIVKTLTPPFPDAYDAASLCWWQYSREDMASGRLAQWLHTPYFIGELNGELAGSMCYYTPAEKRDIGAVEFVRTAEKHRRKGIATVLMTALIERFKSDEGRALYLCTNNPHAGKLYENHGFWYHVGDGMRYLAPGALNFDSDYFGFSGDAHVRDANWSDLPRCAALYNHTEPDWFIKDYLTHCFRDTRYESHFARLMSELDNRMGALMVLEKPGKKAVGAAVLKRFDTFYEQHAALLSFRVVPSYFHQAGELLHTAAKKAESLSIAKLSVYIAECDVGQIRLAKDSGFEEEGRIKGRFQTGAEYLDMLVLGMTLPSRVRPLRQKQDYYGARYPWQSERILNRRGKVKGAEQL